MSDDPDKQVIPPEEFSMPAMPKFDNADALMRQYEEVQQRTRALEGSTPYAYMRYLRTVEKADRATVERRLMDRFNLTRKQARREIVYGGSDWGRFGIAGEIAKGSFMLIVGLAIAGVELRYRELTPTVALLVGFILACAGFFFYSAYSQSQYINSADDPQ